ncbi:hypothetical protein Moror_8308 [Moniliophthora roreri MCA 2997]|uniref:Uncharacterized protein n=1 Tax=Moniliophthora roreri (strain MCA 2997) TaxID=1381753 RepID=V2XKI8_MONRO|nr:hypothetical protein Moror_8308 [Moniliophthora roreri MCA 2997]
MIANSGPTSVALLWVKYFRAVSCSREATVNWTAKQRFEHKAEVPLWFGLRIFLSEGMPFSVGFYNCRVEILNEGWPSRELAKQSSLCA